jgi:tetratricopeptide (TPR) repeat protein
LPYANRGDCHLHLGDDRQALADYEKALAVVPTQTKWRLGCAAIRARLGDGEGAKKDRDLAVAIDPHLKDAPAVALPVPLPPVKKDPE